MANDAAGCMVGRPRYAAARPVDLKMRVLRFIGLVLAVAAAAFFILRAVIVAVWLPYAFWQLFRESRYPWWIQVPAALALAAGFSYLIKAGTFNRRWKE